MSSPSKVPPNVLAALGLLGSVGCDSETSKTVEKSERSTKTIDPADDGRSNPGDDPRNQDEDDAHLGPCLKMAPVGPCLEMMPDTGLNTPKTTELKGPRLGPCLKIAFDDDSTLKSPDTPPAGPDGVGPCLDFAPESIPPPMDVCLSIAPPPTGPLKDDSQACLSEIPDESQGRQTTPHVRDEALARVLDSGVLPPDVAERVEDLSEWL